MRAVRSSVLPVRASSLKRRVGCSGVRFSNRTLLRALSGESKLISPTLSQREVTLAVLGGRIRPESGIAGAQLKRRICDG